MPEEKSFIWIPFYKEMAMKLNAYRENRSELVELVKGIREKYRSYLTNKLFSKLSDIDPFTVMGLINRSGFQRRSEIASYFKDVLKMDADAPRNTQSDWLGIPVLDNTSSVYATEKSEIDLLWDLFAELLQSNYDDSKFEKALQINGVALAKLTMAFYWINPECYCPMDNNTMELLNEKYSWQINKESPRSFQYKKLLDFLHQKIAAGEIESISVLSYEAWKKSHLEDGIRFWSGGIKWGDDNKLGDFKQNEYWQIGWDKANESKGAKEAWKNIKKIKENDFLAFHSYGGTNDLIIWQISKVTSVDKKTGIVNLEQVNKDGEALFHGKAPKMEKGNWFGTLFPVVGATAINEIFGEYLEKDPLDMENQLLTSCKELLQNKKNVILQGAPGTGKTYNTAALALSMIDGLPVRNTDEDDKSFHKKVMDEYEKHLIKFDEEGNVAGDGQIGFVTFHQSMDYEDFVEGIKPKTKDGAVSYNIEDGIFKAISELAKSNFEDSQKNKEELKSELDAKTVFERYCAKIRDELRENDSVELMAKSKLKIREVLCKSDGSAKSISLSKTADSPNQTLSIDMVVRDYPKFKKGEIKSYEDIKPKFESKSLFHGNAVYYFELFKKMKAFEDENKISTDAQKVELKNYVLIIDEINRGNVSKIFGELISLLEADKRVGGDHPLTVTLPYSKEPFSVPSNLYIIGTMNTTDRSVGSIDYAVRRRFAFVTLKADENAIENYYKGKDASLKNKAIELFGKVEAFLRNKDNRSNDMEFDDLMVGHSYFMAETLDELKLKWEYEVIPLLKEYQKDGLLKHSIDIDKDLNVEIQEAKV